MTSIKYRPTSPEFINNPHETYDLMRVSQPFYKAKNSTYILTNYRHIVQTLKDDNSSTNYVKYVNKDAAPYFRRFIELREAMPYLETLHPMLRIDDPRHSEIRRVMQGYFSAAHSATLIPFIEDKITSLITKLSNKTKVDLYPEFAYRIPVDIIVYLLGIPPELGDKLVSWGDALSVLMEPLRTDEQIDDILHIVFDMFITMEEIVNEKEKQNGDDFIAHLCRATIDGKPLERNELIMNIILIFIAGFETTVFFIADSINALLKNPDQLNLWKSFVSATDNKYKDAQINNAIEELLRYDGSVRMTTRVNKTPYVYDPYGKCAIIPAGSMINCILDAANRDPSVFKDPHTLDLRRKNASKNLSLGGGTHNCLGVHLAKIEVIAALSALFQAFPDMQIDGNVKYRDRLLFKGVDYLPVKLN